MKIVKWIFKIIMFSTAKFTHSGMKMNLYSISWKCVKKWTKCLKTFWKSTKWGKNFLKSRNFQKILMPAHFFFIQDKFLQVISHLQLKWFYSKFVLMIPVSLSVQVENTTVHEKNLNTNLYNKKCTISLQAYIHEWSVRLIKHVKILAWLYQMSFLSCWSSVNTTYWIESGPVICENQWHRLYNKTILKD